MSTWAGRPLKSWFGLGGKSWWLPLVMQS